MRKHGVGIRSMPGTVALALLAVMAVGCAGPPAKPVSPSVLPTLAGRWNGYVIGTGGGGSPAVMVVQPDGNYRMTITLTDIVCTGTISVVNGQLVLNNTGLSGPNQDLAGATGTLSLSDKGGKQHLSGNGTNDNGPFSLAFNR
jgi:hypothetical protein